LSIRADSLARLAVLTGCNLSPSQPLIVEGPVEAMPLIEAIARAAEAAGAANIERVIDNPDELRQRLLSGDVAPDSAQVEQMLKVAEKLAAGAARIRVLAPRPDLLEGIAAARILQAHKAWGEANERAAAVLAGKSPADTAVPFPTAAWAGRVFPSISPQEAVTHLWDGLAVALQLDADDTAAAWAAHFSRLETRKAKLETMSLQTLHIQGPDTAMTLTLAEPNIWSGGRLRADNGRLFAPQLPLASLSVAIHPAGTGGRMRITRPIILAGELVSELSIEVSDGTVCAVNAEARNGALGSLLSLAPEARRVQRVALVDRSTPAARMGLNFLNPLLDACATSMISLGGSPHGNAEGTALHIDACFGEDILQISGTDSQGRLHRLIADGLFLV